MTCNKFHLLQEFLQFNSKANLIYDPNYRRRGSCHQIYPFSDMKLCRKLYHPKKQLSVGKSLELFKCQLHFKQYIKTKIVSFGIKIYKLTSSDSITLNFSVNSRNVP